MEYYVKINHRLDKFLLYTMYKGLINLKLNTQTPVKILQV